MNRFMNNKELKAIVNKKLAAKSAELGFIKRKGLYVKPIIDNIYGILAYNPYVSSYTKQILSNTVIGIRIENVEELCYRLRYGEREKYLSFSIGENIGYLMPINKFYEWDFSDEKTIDSQVEKWGNAIKKYAFNYYEEMGSFEKIFDIFCNDKHVTSSQKESYIPVFYYLMGEKEKGLKFIEETIEKYKHISQDHFVTVINMETKEVTKYDANSLTDKQFLGLLKPGYTVQTSNTPRLEPYYPEFVERYRALE